jgi:hypothetical protein
MKQIICLRTSTAGSSDEQRKATNIATVYLKLKMITTRMKRILILLLASAPLCFGPSTASSTDKWVFVC